MASLQHVSLLAAKARGRPAIRIPKPNIRFLELRHIARIKELIDVYIDLASEAIYNQLDYIAPVRQDDPADIIERTFAGLRVRLAQFFDLRRLRSAAEETAQLVDSRNRDLFRRQIKTVIGVDPIQSEPWLIEEVTAFVKENVSLIKSIPEENLSDIEQMLYRDYKLGLSPKQMKSKIQEKFGVAESRAELIAVDQVGKFNSRLTQLRQTTLGVKKYIWRTAQDQRVRGNPSGAYPNSRPSHWALEGKIFSWEEAPVSGTQGERLHPGQPIRCRRCYAEPILDDLLS